MKLNNDFGQKCTDTNGVVTYLGARYYVSAYTGSKHKAVLSGDVKIGALIATTWNIGSSKDLEVAAWKIRIELGEVSKIEVSLNGRVVESYS